MLNARKYLVSTSVECVSFLFKSVFQGCCSVLAEAKKATPHTSWWEHVKRTGNLQPKKCL